VVAEAGIEDSIVEDPAAVAEGIEILGDKD
jgi:hypothetical protein